MKKVAGIVNFHSSPEISPITDSRPLGSTSYLGRYAFCDFALSNLCNSGISSVGLMVKNHQRSILKHLGSMDSWVINTKISQTRILYNEPAQRDPRLNTDVNNLLENDWLLYDASYQMFAIVPSHIVMPIDLRPFIERHVEANQDITLIAAKQDNLKQHWIGSKVFKVNDKGELIGWDVNKGQFSGKNLVNLDVILINRPTLVSVLRQYAPTHPSMDLVSLLLAAHDEGRHKIALDYYDGYARCIDSFQHYMDYSFEILDRKNAERLFLKSWPIYTLTHDTPPALYGGASEVRNSYISNGSRIEGKVINSIIARNVHVGKGAVVRNSIIFSTVRINDNASVENALVDKYSIIERGHVLKGKAKDPLYVHQGAIL
ncbi:MAG: glucose-1-phosphate adenylyltransferase subunit GlgD [Bacilli bacterium]|nr:glucose-1-phosphate adenylyltransferase subunit GlgD [Bacilli bacterium]